jgi:hypothetical protein
MPTVSFEGLKDIPEVCVLSHHLGLRALCD